MNSLDISIDFGESWCLKSMNFDQGRTSHLKKESDGLELMGYKSYSGFLHLNYLHLKTNSYYKNFRHRLVFSLLKFTLGNFSFLFPIIRMEKIDAQMNDGKKKNAFEFRSMEYNMFSFDQMLKNIWQDFQKRHNENCQFLYFDKNQRLNLIVQWLNFSFVLFELKVFKLINVCTSQALLVYVNLLDCVHIFSILFCYSTGVFQYFYHYFFLHLNFLLNYRQFKFPIICLHYRFF